VVSPGRSASRLLAAACLCFAACDEGGYDLVVRFDPASLAAEVSSVEVALVPSCEGQPRDGSPATSAIRLVSVDRDGSAEAIGRLDPGRYGLHAVGRSEDACAAVAFGCAPVDLEAGGRGTLVVVLGPADGPGCEPDQRCESGACVPADCPPSCVCSDTCSTSSPCVCDSGCPCTDLACESDCAVACTGEGTACVVDATDVSHFDAFACDGGASCVVDLTNSRGTFEADVVCSGSGTLCHLLCDKASSCFPECIDGATCLLDCSRTHDCGFDRCDGGASDCGGDVLVCNGSCP
jgi:hypothetical protein